MKKKIFSAILAANMILTSYAFDVQGVFAATNVGDKIEIATEIAGGSCGDGVVWSLFSDYGLEIRGAGDMDNYSSYLDTPWYEYADKITRVTIYSNVTNISAYAFSNLNVVESVYISSGVTKIGDGAFRNCPKLTSITVDAENSAYSSLNGCLYNKEQTTLLCVPGGMSGDYAISETVESIDLMAFNGCNSLTGINVPASVVDIPYTAFYYCKALKTITVAPENKYYSAYDGILYSKDRKNLIQCPRVFSGTCVIRSGVETIDRGAFSECMSLSSVVIPDTVTTIKSNAFNACWALKTVTMHTSVKNVEDSAFSGCKNLENIYYYGTQYYWNKITFGNYNQDITTYATLNFMTQYNGTIVYGDYDNDGDVDKADSNAIMSNIGASDVEYDLRTLLACDVNYDGIVNVLDAQKILLHLDNKVLFNIIAEGICGSKVRWILYSDGELVIKGTGNMLDFQSYSAVPWYPFASKIKTVRYDKNITSYTRVAFNFIDGLTDIYYSGTRYEWHKIAKNMSAVGYVHFTGEDFYNGTIIFGDYDNDGDVDEDDPNGMLDDNVMEANKEFDMRTFLACDLDFDGKITSSDVYKIILHVEGSRKLDTVAKGVCGTNVTWTLGSDGELVISGTGDMEVHSSKKTLPWYNYRSSIKKVTIENGVTSVSRYSFNECENLTHITIPESVMSIGYSLVLNSNNLIDITVDANNTAYSSENGVLFNKEKTNLIQYPTGKSGAYTIPDSVTSIGNSAFRNSINLTDITFGCDLLSIGSTAFQSCDSLKSVIIPDTVTDVKASAFYNCSGLETVVIGNGVTEIEGSVFADCYALKTVTIPNTITEIGSAAFRDCSSLKDVYYGGTESEWNAITIVGTYNAPLTNATIHFPKAVLASGDCGDNAKWTLYDDYELEISGTGAMDDYSAAMDYPWYNYYDRIKSITVKNGITKIGDYAFYYCKKATSVTIADSVTEIGDSAFNHCEALTAIKLPKNLASIGKFAFLFTYAVESITLDSSNTSFVAEDNVLFNKNKTELIYCANKKSGTYTVPGTVTKLADGAFGGCKLIGEIILPDGLLSIGEACFIFCSSVNSLQIPDRVTSIGSEAFQVCMALEEIKLPAGITVIRQNTFSDCLNLREVVLPDNITTLESNSFGGAMLTSLTIPESLTTVNENVFGGSGSVSDIYYAGTSKDWNEISIASGNDPLTNATKHFGKYIISYDANGGENAPVEQTKTKGTAIKLSNQIPTNGDRTFLGWATSENAVTPEYQPGSNFTTDNDTVLYAVWETIESCATPVITVKPAINGKTFEITCATSGATIFYKVTKNDNSEISLSSEEIYYIDQSESLNNSLINSDLEDGEYIVRIGGDDSNITETEFVVADANDYGALYDDSQTVIISTPGEYTISAIAILEGYIDSAEATVETTVSKASKPVIVLGNVMGGKTLTMSTDVGIYPIYYTLDGTEPTFSSNIYSTPLSLTTAGTYTVKAKAMLDGYVHSDTMSGTVTLEKTELPMSSSANCSFVGSMDITLKSQTEGAVIYYTTNGDKPTVNSTVYNGVITITDTTQIKAIAVANGYAKSDISGYTYTREIPAYTVTYNYSYNGGTSATVTSASVSDGESIDLTPTATKSGWTFVGWTQEEGSTTPLTSLTATGDTTLYAIYKKTLTANFYYGNNTLQTSKAVTIYNNATSGTITAPMPSSYSGWTAKGWRDDTTAGVYEKTAGNITISSNINFYAVYSRTLTLSYNANGGSTTPSAQTATQYYNAYGNKQNVSFTLASAISRTGYTFDKWVMGSASGTGYNANTAVTIADNTIMYATWTVKTYTVTYNANGGTNAPSQQTKTHGTALTLSTQKPVYDGYDFLGWATTVNGEVSYTPGGSYTIDAPITLYAVWEYVPVEIDSGVCGDDITWTLNENGVLMIVGSGDMYDYTYTTVPWLAYKNSITSVVISEDITSIGNYAFYQLSKITEIEIPSTISDIGNYVFRGCSKLADINVNELNEDYTSVDGVLYNHEQTELVAYPGGKSGAFTVPSTVNSIAVDAFAYCSGLTAVVLPAGLTEIKNTTFYNCTSLESVIIPEGVTIINSSAFNNCTKLKEISLPKTLTSVANNAFYNCSGIESVDFAGTRYQWENEITFSLGNDALLNAQVVFGTVINHTVTYNYAYNGGTSATKQSAQVESGYGADLTVTAVKAGWEFVGWNTNPDATIRLASLNVTSDTVLYAIYKKTLNAEFYSKDNALQTTKTVTLYNNSTSGKVSAPTPGSYSGWTARGWRDDKTAGAQEYSQSAEVTISADSKFYAVYSRTLTLSYNANGATTAPSAQTATQYYNAAGNKQSKSFTLADAITRDGYIFAGWSKNGNTSDVYTAKSNITLDDNAVMYAQWTEEEVIQYTVTFSARLNGRTQKVINTYNENQTLTLPECPFESNVIGDKLIANYVYNQQYYLPGDTITVTQNMSIRCTVISPLITTYDEETQMVSAAHPTEEVLEITAMGFKYKAISESSYKTVTLESGAEFEAVLRNLNSDTEYECYAFEKIMVGTRAYEIKGTTVNFKTKGNSVTLSDNSIYLPKGATYTLTAKVEGEYEDNALVWSSSKSTVVKVDSSTGKLTAKKAGTAVITVKVKNTNLSAKCTVTVNDALKNVSFDFSEWNLAMRLSQNGQEAEKGYLSTEITGANVMIGLAGLARWDGVVKESADKYPSAYKSTNYNTTAQNIYHIQNAYILPSRAGYSIDNTNTYDAIENYNKNVKYALTNYGAVYTAYYGGYLDFWNEDETAFFNNEADVKFGGHAVTIVGWDDNYSRYNFSYTAPANGAFLCKNSYGTGTNDNGYFYISYYDAGLDIADKTMVFPGAGTPDNYDTIYEYDPYGAITSMSKSNEILTANVFDVKTSGETLEAVSFYTHDMATSYEVYVVTDYENVSDLNGLENCVASGVLNFAGYHTVKFDSIELGSEGEAFAVAVKIKKPGGEAHAYIELPLSSNDVNGLHSKKATASAGESYLYLNNRWVDLTTQVSRANNCIKAFTRGGIGLSSYITTQKLPAQGDALSIDEALSLGLNINPEYIEYVNNQSIELFADETTDAITPSTAIFGSDSTALADNNFYSDKYSLKEMGLVTSVKDQGRYNTCWAHAIYGSLESCMMKRMLKTGSALLNGGIGGADEVEEVINADTYTAVSGISLDKTEYLTAVGNKFTINETVYPISAVVREVSWVSSNPAIAVVDTHGNVTALAVGTVTVTAITKEGGYSEECVIEVTEPVEPEYIMFNEASQEYSIGEVAYLDYTVYPTNSADGAVTWSSDNENIALIDEYGFISMLNSGNTVISVTDSHGNYATKTIKVVDGFDIHTTTTVWSATGVKFVSVEVDNTVDGMQIMVAAYDENDMLIEVQYVDMTQDEYNLGFMNNVKNIKYFKTFVWDENMKPLSKTEIQNSKKETV